MDVLGFLPNSPFITFIDAMDGSAVLSTINWIIPISTFISIGQAWLSAIAIFYVYQIALRFINAIE